MWHTQLLKRIVFRLSVRCACSHRFSILALLCAVRINCLPLQRQSVMADAKMNNHHGKECSCSKNAYGVAESMEEMEFSRSLWGACVIGDIERIERLISKGVDVNVEDSSGYAPLHYASRNGHSQACSILLKNGALVNKKTRSGQATSLHRAAYAGHEEVVKVLLAAAADPCAQDSYGCTSLHKAVNQGHKWIASMLTNVNMKVSEIRDNKGLLPSDY